MKEEKKDSEIEELMEEEAPSPHSSIMDQETVEPSMFSQNTNEKEEPQQNTIQSSFTNTPTKLNYSQSNIDEIEELIESVVDEKWRTLMENVGDIGLWKDKVRTEIISIKQELVRLENRFESLQKAILGKVSSYDEHIIEVGSEIKALEKVFGKILDPLTTNIKELDRITKKLRG